jgi:hypothetical protein
MDRQPSMFHVGGNEIIYIFKNRFLPPFIVIQKNSFFLAPRFARQQKGKTARVHQKSKAVSQKDKKTEDNGSNNGTLR